MVIKKIFSKKTIIQYRYTMAIYAKANNITKAAIEYNTTRKTVRKWFNVYEKDKLICHNKAKYLFQTKR
jgi:hypothetical protein